MNDSSSVTVSDSFENLANQVHRVGLTVDSFGNNFVEQLTSRNATIAEKRSDKMSLSADEPRRLPSGTYSSSSIINLDEFS